MGGSQKENGRMDGSLHHSHGKVSGLAKIHSVDL